MTVSMPTMKKPAAALAGKKAPPPMANPSRPEQTAPAKLPISIDLNPKRSATLAKQMPPIAPMIEHSEVANAACPWLWPLSLARVGSQPIMKKTGTAPKKSAPQHGKVIRHAPLRNRDGRTGFDAATPPRLDATTSRGRYRKRTGSSSNGRIQPTTNSDLQPNAGTT